MSISAYEFERGLRGIERGLGQVAEALVTAAKIEANAKAASSGTSLPYPDVVNV